ncbi:amidohydrolase 2 [Desulfotomaculum nigrificans CO-1-SRB]|uniref:Amidohydrolase 2 n=1 Tax=Desulfotomaculum nigrificans (strain DSM 14880 / VKM B-2319 / CO-1-SRB) TaxID=868595 RepID=F6BA18_DESCC|nr:amidohydrolase family protein [Desulfotomaculum nigrificans]AEF94987.1 amidohydrolase 2 [Desulfotomaculum nigrificans CO-1-SRB]
MLIDMHVHVFPDTIAPKVKEQLNHHYGLPVHHQGTRQEFKNIMRLGHVDTAVFFTAATRPDQVPAANHWAITNTRDGLLGFGTLHPDYDNIEGEIKKLKKAGVKGIKFHPDFQQFYLDDPKALTLYEKIARDFVVIFHIGDDTDGSKINYSTPERLARVLDYIPGLRVIAAHMGGYLMWDRSLKHLVGKKLYFDTSSCYGILPNEQFKFMIKEHGADKILLGSDYPFNSPLTEVANLTQLALAEKELQAITGENARALMGSLGL